MSLEGVDEDGASLFVSEEELVLVVVGDGVLSGGEPAETANDRMALPPVAVVVACRKELATAIVDRVITR